MWADSMWASSKHAPGVLTVLRRYTGFRVDDDTSTVSHDFLIPLHFEIECVYARQHEM